MDRTKIHFDFLVHKTVDGLYARKFRELGCDIYPLTPRRESVLKNFRDIFRGMSRKKYDIIHSHIGAESFIPLSMAFFKGIDVRIAGAHCAIRPNILKKCMLWLTYFFATKYAACSDLSALVTFKKKSGEYFLLKNGVDVQRFLFNEENRITIRNQYHVDDDCILLGNIGRLVWEKNQKFLIDLLYELNKGSIARYKLMIVGDGILKEDLQSQAKEHGILSQVFFVEPQNEIEKYYSAFDVFMFPSTNEGFGIVAIEAQINGLPVLASNTLSNELNISPMYRSIDVNNINVWCENLKKLNCKYSKSNRKIQSIRKEDYDIAMLADSLMSFYKENAN